LADLVLSGNTLYGTSEYGGTGGGATDDGVVFKIDTGGNNFAVLHKFLGSDGYYPMAGLASNGTNFFGVTSLSGTGEFGAVFEISPDGTTFDVLASSHPGEEPYYSGLLLSGRNLYGVATFGGSGNEGTIFSLPYPPFAVASNLVHNANGSVTLNFAVWTNSTYILQATTNLTQSTWQPLATNFSGPNFSWQYTDTDAPALSARFFRTSP
jgi:uncharacterized repeat protein (TIGR03803 family)